jgi:hypothetical protein
VLASPTLGAGIALSFIDSLFLNGPGEAGAMVQQASQAVTASGRRLLKGERPVEDAGELRNMLEERAKGFLGTLLPFLRQLGVAD